MIDELRGMAVFVAVAESGSFSAAARRLKLAPSVVSHHVNKLESRLGVALLFRSTRALSLTNEGENMLEPARRMVAAAEEAIDLVSDQSEQHVGAIRITMPAFGDNSPVLRTLWEFAHDHPLVGITLRTTDRPVDLVRDGFDLGIRLGELKDSALKSRRFGQFYRMLVASPQYLKSRPAIRSIDDLAECDFVSISLLPESFELVQGSEKASFTAQNLRLEVNSVAAAKAAVVAGLGIQRLPLSEISNELQSGELVRVLPEWSMPVGNMYAVWPDTGRQKQLVRLLIDFLAERTRIQNEKLAALAE